MRTPAPDNRRLLTVLIAAALTCASGAAIARAGASAPAQPYFATIERPATLPGLRPVRVAVVDGRVDMTHPDLAGRIVASRRFAHGVPSAPETTHATAVAGLIAAASENGLGIDGIAPNAELLLADVSSASDASSFDEDAIGQAIRWATNRGARVINLSFGGLGSQPAQLAAIDYAVAHGVLVVAAAGNCFGGDASRCTPGGSTYAPAWQPHVLAVGATHDASTASAFSIPSARWVDLAAPGELVTTLWPTRDNPYTPDPRCLYAGTTACYSTGGTDSQVWGPTGTSYAAPMVSAAAAILFGADPALTPAQATALLVETARPLAADPLHQSGAGVLDVAAALARVEAGNVPKPDVDEPNESTRDAATLSVPGSLDATIDWQDDPQDIYRLSLRRGDALSVRTSGVPHGTALLVRDGRRIASAPLGGSLRTAIAETGVYILRISAAAHAAGSYTLVIRDRQ